VQEDGMKTEDKRKRVFEITDKEAIAKLSGIQLSILQMEKSSVELSKFIPEKRGICTACTILCQRLMEDCPTISSKVQAGQMTPEEAKIRINQIKLNAEIIREIGDLNKDDIIALNAKVEDRLATANNLVDTYYNYALKYETQERLAKEEEEKEKEEKKVEETEEKTEVLEEKEKKEKLKKILKKTKEKKAPKKRKPRAKKENLMDPKYLKTYNKKVQKFDQKQQPETDQNDKKIFGPLKIERK
jgi:hypothetical protein